MLLKDFSKTRQKCLSFCKYKFFKIKIVLLKKTSVYEIKIDAVAALIKVASDPPSIALKAQSAKSFFFSGSRDPRPPI